MSGFLMSVNLITDPVTSTFDTHLIGGYASEHSSLNAKSMSFSFQNALIMRAWYAL